MPQKCLIGFRSRDGCQSVVSMNSSLRICWCTPQTDSHTQGPLDQFMDWHWAWGSNVPGVPNSVRVPLTSTWIPPWTWTYLWLSLTHHQTGHAGGCSRRQDILQSHLDWSVSTGPTCDGWTLIPRSRSLFLTVWAETCTWVASWRSLCVVPPLCSCTKEQIMVCSCVDIPWPLLTFPCVLTCLLGPLLCSWHAGMQSKQVVAHMDVLPRRSSSTCTTFGESRYLLMLPRML